MGLGVAGLAVLGYLFFIIFLFFMVHEGAVLDQMTISF